MNVLIIPEDFGKDQHLLKPIIQAMMSNVGRPRAKVRVCAEPLLGGIGQALQWERLAEIVDLNPLVHLFLLCVDRDSIPGRRAALDAIERRARMILSEERALFAEHAWQEIEVWALAGHDLPAEWAWRVVRAEGNPKERYFEPFASSLGLADEPDGGRGALARVAARRYDRIRQLCPEDIAALEDRIRAWLERSRRSSLDD